MSHTARWAVVISVASVATVAIAPQFIPSELSQSQLSAGPPPHIPAQASRATVECLGGTDISVADVGRDWSVIQDHPACVMGGIVPPSINATAAEMSRISQRPEVTFKLSTKGVAAEGAIVRSSGSKTLDERALTQVMATRYPHHNCGICKFSTAINVEFHGPVWFRDRGPAR